MQRDRVYTASEFLRSLYRCREKAAEQYAAERQRIDADGILSSVRSGTLHRLKNMKSCVRLALLMELMTDMKKNGSKWSIPLKLFHDMDQAANALLYLEP